MGTLPRKRNGTHYSSLFENSARKASDARGGYEASFYNEGFKKFKNQSRTYHNTTLKSRLLHIVPYFFLLFFCNVWVNAQPEVKALASKNTIRTGEQITIKLTALWPGHSGFTTGFIIPDSIPHIDIWEQQQPLAVKNGIEQQLTITSYDSGQFTIPAFKLNTPTAQTPAATFATSSIIVNVMPVNVDSLKEYHDIKDIIEVPPIKQWPYILGIAIATIAAAIGLYFLLKKMGVGNKPTRLDFENSMAPYPAAMYALNLLEQDCKLQTTNCKLFFIRLTNIYRTYLNDAHQFRSHQQTGGELILQATPLLQGDLFFQFANTIRLCDAAKFAKYEPPKTERIASIKTIKEAITEMNTNLYKPQSIKA